MKKGIHLKWQSMINKALKPKAENKYSYALILSNAVHIFLNVLAVFGIELDTSPKE